MKKNSSSKRSREKYISALSSKIKLENIKFNTGFWATIVQVINEKVIPYQWKALNDQIPGAKPSHAVENFRIAAGELDGEFSGRVFQDSDVAKWLEAACYSLVYSNNSELESIISDLTDLIEKAQQPDGYLNTFFTVDSPEERWANVRDRHEMYCAGHMIEAAVAHYEATGKRKLLNVACRIADHIDSKFGPDEGKVRGYPGHQEIELALIKLYKATGEGRYLNLSKFFVEERGQQPHFFDLEADERGEEEKKHYRNIFNYQYSQSHLPLKEQETATGHAVRAMYFYSAVADVALETGDKELEDAVKRLWKDVTRRQMYVTGGIGAEDYGEAFSFGYDLPNDRAYTETCAAIGMVFWAQRMLNLELNGKYGDIMERVLYNGVLSGISLDGYKYFYVNPLEVWPEAAKKRFDLRHVKNERQKWFGCACCPPNIARLMASIGKYVYSTNDSGIFLHLYADSSTYFMLSGREVTITQKTDYPWDGEVAVELSCTAPAEFILGLRLPGWCRKPSLKINGEFLDVAKVIQNGYAILKRKWKNGDRIGLSLPMPVEKIAAHPEVRENSGKLALQRGPVVYCLEEEDNGSNLQDIALLPDEKLRAEFVEELLGGVVIIKGEAMRTAKPDWGGELYKPYEESGEKVGITAVPYYTWANRKPGEMLVWIRKA